MKVKIDKYTFDASAKTIEFVGYDVIDLDRVLLITNVTDNIIIYNFADSDVGGTVDSNILTLTYDTTSMSDSDELLIFYQEENYEVTEGGQMKLPIIDSVANETLKEILTVLNKIEYHLSLASDTNL